MLLILSGLPGSFIMFVPGFKWTNQSASLNIFLTVLVSFVPLGLIGLYGFFSEFARVKNIIQKRLNLTIHLLIWSGWVSLVIGFLMNEEANNKIGLLQSFNLAAIGLAGSNFEVGNYITSVSFTGYLVQISITFFSFILKNIIIGVFLFELLDEMQAYHE